LRSKDIQIFKYSNITSSHYI